MWQAGAKSVNPSDLKMALSSKYRMYSGSAQQDAQEFLRYLLEALHGALNTGGQKISLHIEDDMRFVGSHLKKTFSFQFDFRF